MAVWGDFVWDDDDTDKTKIRRHEHEYVPCRICREVFQRIRLTLRYCDKCERAFCEGEHGNFAGGGTALCVRCFHKAESELAENSN
jgi:hypothetical protein